MLFNSIDFAIFLPLVFIIYWFVVNKNLNWQNGFILAASYVFYGWWDWRFLFLIAISSFSDYYIGISLSLTEEKSKRKLLLFLSLFVNLGLLGFFKYYNFFVESFIDAFSFFGTKQSYSTIQIILPVGISFYTFQTMSYTIDVYKREIDSHKGLISFLAYVSFFPQLVAGPIERAKNLLPQFKKERVFDSVLAKEGFNQMIWGLLKKIVVADTCGVYVNEIYSGINVYPNYVLLFGAFFFYIQVYADFSGYSDIAIGISKMFGFHLKTNFRMPHFSRDVSELWRRWHISLSTWFRDYLYIPLGGSNVQSNWIQIRNVLIIFLVSGFWHGANWNFVIWGGLNGLLFLPLIIFGKNRKHLDVVAEGRILPNIKEIVQIGITFTLVSLTCIFFRSQTFNDALLYIGRLFSFDYSGSMYLSGSCQRYFFEIIPLLFVFYLFEWFNRKKESVINTKTGLFIAILLILVLGEFSNRSSFIYFQF